MIVSLGTKNLPGLRLGFGCLVLSLFTLGCGGGSDGDSQESRQPARRVSVAAAADLQFAFDEVLRDFTNEHQEIEVRVTYGSSGNFFAQLTNRAPFDLYFSADVDYPHQLVKRGLADGESTLLYAMGQIVVWVPNQSDIDVQRLEAQALLEPSIRKIAIANPQHAPYGRAAESAMKSLGVFDQVKDRLVLGENIAQASQFVESGAADIGVIALSLAMAPAMQSKGRYWVVPLDAYPQMDQGSVILNWAKDREATDAFRSFVAGPRGREILQRYGFILPGE